MEANDRLMITMNKKTISQIFTLAFLFLFIWYGVTHKEALEVMKSVSIISLLFIVAGRLTVYAGNGMFIKWTTEAFTDKLSTGESFYVGMLSAIGNFFGPLLGGASIRAVYLKRFHKLSYSNFTSTLMSYYVILFLINFSLAVISLLLLPKTSQTGALILFFCIGIIVLVGFTFIKLPDKNVVLNKSYSNLFNKIIETIYNIGFGWKIIVKKGDLLFKLTGLALLSFSAQYMISFVEFKAIGVEVSPAALGLYTAILSISLLVSFTPGAIGVRESMLIFIGLTLGVSTEQILQVAIIDRGVTFLLLFALFLITRSTKIKNKLINK